jgi:hypothetical protein
MAITKESREHITFGENVSKIRQLIGQERGYIFTQEEFAKLVQRGRSQIANWESLGKKPKDDKIADIAWIFGLDFHTLKYGRVTQLGADWHIRASRPKYERLDLAQTEIVDLARTELLEACKTGLEAVRQAHLVLEREWQRIVQLISKSDNPMNPSLSNSPAISPN